MTYVERCWLNNNKVTCYNSQFKKCRKEINKTYEATADEMRKLNIKKQIPKSLQCQ